MSILILDTETTGKQEPSVIELAYVRVNFPDLENLASYEQRFKPNKVIEYGAMATHHIVMKDLIDKPDFSTFDFSKLGCEYLIGHNIDYDWKVIGEPDVKRIDTLAIARTLYPDLDTHTLGALLYFFEGSPARELLKHNHSALTDVYNCSLVLSHLLLTIRERKLISLKSFTIENLWKFSEDCRTPKIFTFGKYKGQEIAKVKRNDPGYISWLFKQAELDDYLRTALLK